MLILGKNVKDVFITHAKAALRHANSLSTIQRLFAGTFLLFIAAFSILSIKYHTAIFAAIESWKTELTTSRCGWTILAGVTALVSFPPLIGYATSVTLSGYVFGFVKGWFVAVAGTVVGASVTFLVYRYALSTYAARMSSQNKNFMALTRALDGSEGLGLLTMVRMCPFPFSLSNAALSTIPSITFARFVFATTVGSVRLLVHAFVGSRIADLAADPNPDNKSKIVNAVGIVGGIIIGLLTGLVVYKRTKVIANRLAESTGVEEEGQSSGFDNDEIFSDDDDDEGDEDSTLRTVTSHERAALLK